MFNELKFSNPLQICAAKGSIIMVDRMLAHLISSPNNSNDYIRKIVWFRIKSVEKSYEHLVRQITKYDTKEIIDLEISGKCYLDQNNLDSMILYAKPNMEHHIPNLFASMVKINGTYVNGEFVLTDVHSCGFLSKETHLIWSKQLAKINNLTEIVETINKIDYNQLLKSFFIVPEDKPKQYVNATIVFHHLHSLSKSRMMTEWADIFGITVDIVRGTPGRITMTGDLNSIIAYKNQGIDRLHWSKNPTFVVVPKTI
jgi:hypothetical protein